MFLGIVAVALLGSFIQVTCGLGYAVICVSLWSLFLPLKTAVVLELITGVISMLFMAIRQRWKIRWDLLLWPTVFSCAASLLGFFALFQLNTALLYRLLGLLLIGLGTFFYAFSDRAKLRPTTATGIAAGLIGGFFGGLFGIAGPPVAVYLLAVSDGKEEYSATIQAHFSITSVFLILIHSLAGNLDRQVLMFGAMGVAGVLAGLALGLIAFRRLTDKGLKKLVGLFLIGMGAFYLLRTFF